MSISKQGPVISGYPEDSYRVVLGLISGTSADGVDVAVVRLPPVRDVSANKLELLDFKTVPYPSQLKQRVLEAAQDRIGLREAAVLHTELGEFFAQVAKSVIPSSGCHLLASHGQTVCHLPEARTTLQLGEGSIIANRTGVLTVTDFRTADMALGGQGAPLVPLFDSYLLADKSATRIAINLGGIANITVISPGGLKIRAWDTGPANCLSDALCRLHDQGDYDPDGAMAGSGKVNEELFNRILANEFFRQSPPKSTGLEDFGEEFCRMHLMGRDFREALRTSNAIAAQTLVDAIADTIVGEKHSGPVELVFAGGGTSNRTLMREIDERLIQAAKSYRFEQPIQRSFAEFGVPEDAREAVAFAFLGDRTARGLSGAVPSTTGAEKPAILGKISIPTP